jgi:hypothetical protein
MLTKPWNLYIFRHSSLTDKSQILTESLLKEHAGWSMSSSMPQVYVHLKGESSKILLQNRGIIKKEDSKKILALKCKQCPNCNESNKPESKFCMKCRMVLSYDSYEATVEKQEVKNDVISNLSDRVIQLTKEMVELRDLLNQKNLP